MRQVAARTAGTICSSGLRRHHFIRSHHWTQSRWSPLHACRPASTVASSLQRSSPILRDSSLSTQDEHHTGQQDGALSKSFDGNNEPRGDITLNWTFEDLERQCQVEREDDTAILVNQTYYRHDVVVWAALLRHCSRVKGAAGVLNIWEGMRKRNVRLPVEGELAVELWRLVIEAAHEGDGVNAVLDYVVHSYRETRRTHADVYPLLIGPLLRTSPQNVWPLHRRLKEIGLPQPGTLKLLVKDASSSGKGLQIFERLYKDSNDATLYDAMIMTLCNEQRYLEAVYWHDLLTSRGDYPSSTEVTEPLRAHLKLKKRIHRRSHSGHLAHAALTLPSYHSRFVSERPEAPSTLSRFFMNKVLGEKHGISQKYISDSTCAKALATRAFSVDFVTRSLSAFGVESIGPLALRELGLRSEHDSSLITHIKLLSTLNIKIDDCVYSQLILKLASDEKSELLKVLLASDQHPEVFEDHDLQDRLLTQHIRNEDWSQVHIALLALTHGHSCPEHHAYNILLRARVDTGNLDLIQSLMDEMIQNGVRISTKSIRYAFFQLVPSRRPGQRPIVQENKNDGLDNFIALLVRMMRQGHPVNLAVWKQPLVYLGLERRIHDVEILSIWLLLVYSKQLPAEERADMYKALFPLNLQKAIATWGFQSVVKPGPAPELSRLLTPALLSSSFETSQTSSPTTQRSTINFERTSKSDPAHIFHEVAMQKFFSGRRPWTRGIALLRLLKDFGVEVDADAVRKVCLQWCRQLFGNRVSARRFNRLARRTNRASLLTFMKSVSIAWGSRGARLFPVETDKHIMLEREVMAALLRSQKQPRHSRVGSAVRRQVVQSGGHRISPAQVTDQGEAST